jgi:hypothetical protein
MASVALPSDTRFVTAQATTSTMRVNATPYPVSIFFFNVIGFNPPIGILCYPWSSIGRAIYQDRDFLGLFLQLG